MTFERGSWRVDPSHPKLADDSVRLERSEVAPWFGQSGGGSQYRFIQDGEALTMDELIELRIIVEAP